MRHSASHERIYLYILNELELRIREERCREVFAVGEESLSDTAFRYRSVDCMVVVPDWITFISFFDTKRTNDRCEKQELPRPAIVAPVTST